MMMKTRFRVFFVFLLILCEPAFSQNVTFKAGASKLLYDQRYYHAIFGEKVAPVIPTFGVNIGWKDYSSEPVAAICNHPEYGIAFQVDGLADAMAIDGPGAGNIYSLYGYFDRAFVQTQRVRLGYYAGMGLATCFSKLYDPLTNPHNLILSAPVNSRIKFGLQMQYSLSRRYFAGIGFYFNHSSNGALMCPNRGYNAYEVSLALGMRNNGDMADRLPEPVDDGFKRRFQFDVQASCGIMSNEEYYYYLEKSTGVGGNMYIPKYSFAADALYKYSRIHATGVGLDLFVTPLCDEISQYLYLYRSLDNPDTVKEEFEPVSVGVSILHEMSYRNVSVTAGIGRYLYHNDGVGRYHSLYQMVHLKYHFVSLADCYVGITLKAHKFMVAESVQFCIGKRF